MTVNIGDHVALIFPNQDPEAEPTERNALVVSAPDPADQEEGEDAKRPLLNVVTVSAESGYNDRYGRRPEYFTAVQHETDYEPDTTGSAGAPAPYWA